MSLQPDYSPGGSGIKPGGIDLVIGNRTLAALIWRLEWQSEGVRHTEELYALLNVWRELDLCPAPLGAALWGQPPGFVYRQHLEAGALVAPYTEAQVVSYPVAAFGQGRYQPRLGRFYPKGLLTGSPGAGQLGRVCRLEGDSFWFDLNHPLAGRPLALTVTVDDVLPKRGDTGGLCQDWLGLLVEGPGQQARWRGQPTDFFADDPFRRQDEQPDAAFYARPRLVSHLDRQAQQLIQQLYGRLLPPGGRVLDLMSSWQSHLPAALPLEEVIGLGLNEVELAHNPRLTGYVVQDLNQNPALPWPSDYFDGVICTSSVEYLIRPLDVFQEVARVLKPGGIFALTFSNRWFPPKVIKIWTEILDYERLGLVLEYFWRSGRFTALETFVSRGWPRPVDDKYFPQVRFADPVFAAWGRKES